MDDGQPRSAFRRARRLRVEQPGRRQAERRELAGASLEPEPASDRGWQRQPAAEADGEQGGAAQGRELRPVVPERAPGGGERSAGGRVGQAAGETRQVGLLGAQSPRRDQDQVHEHGAGQRGAARRARQAHQGVREVEEAHRGVQDTRGEVQVRRPRHEGHDRAAAARQRRAQELAAGARQRGRAAAREVLRGQAEPGEDDTRVEPHEGGAHQDALHEGHHRAGARTRPSQAQRARGQQEGHRREARGGDHACQHDQRRLAQVGGQRGHDTRTLHAAQGREGGARGGQQEQDRPDARQTQGAANAEQAVHGPAQGAEQAVRPPERGEQAAADVRQRLPQRERHARQAVGLGQRQAEAARARAREAAHKRPVPAQRGGHQDQRGAHGPHRRAQQPAQDARQHAHREPAHQGDAHREGLGALQSRLRAPSAPGSHGQESAHDCATRAHAQGQPEAVHKRHQCAHAQLAERRRHAHLRAHQSARHQLLSTHTHTAIHTRRILDTRHANELTNETTLTHTQEDSEKLKNVDQANDEFDLSSPEFHVWTS